MKMLPVSKNETESMRRRLSVETRRELIEAVGGGYRAAGRLEKKHILDEFAEIADTTASMQFAY
jgi:hypothetical protein